jgi:hypothetical protein
MRSFPWAYRDNPGGGGVTSVAPIAGVVPNGPSPSATGGFRHKITPGAGVSPLGSALYLPRVRAMADRTLPPQYWGEPGT